MNCAVSRRVGRYASLSHGFLPLSSLSLFSSSSSSLQRLVEVNASPSLTANTKDDEAMKVTMLAAMLDIIDLEGDRTGDEVLFFLRLPSVLSKAQGILLRPTLVPLVNLLR